MSLLVVRVLGTEPVPQGSKTAFVNRATGRAIVTDQNAKVLKPWRATVTDAAVEAVEEQEWSFVAVGAMRVTLDFVFTRPKAHYRADGRLKDTAPVYKETKPDIDKLARAILDSLTGVVFRDDSQVSSLVASKRYVAEHEDDIGVNIVCDTLSA